MNNSIQKRIGLNISETKKNLDGKNMNRINNIESIKKENIKRTELFKPKSKKEYIQNFYSNTTNNNTNSNTNKKSFKISNNNNSINTNNNKQDEKKKEKIFIEFNSNITNSDSNQKDILLEPSDITQLNGLIPKKNKINNKRNKGMYTLDTVKSYNKNEINNFGNRTNNLDYKTYTLPFKRNIIKVNKNNEKNNKIKKYIKTLINKNSKSSTNLKSNIKSNDKQYINTDFKNKLLDKQSLSNTNSEKNLKIITNNNIRFSTNNIAKSTKNTLNIQIYLSDCNNRKKFNKKKLQKSFNHISIPKENIQLNTNRSLDIKHKKAYSNSSRLTNHRIEKSNKININNKNININIDLFSEEKNIEKKEIIGNNAVSIPEYKLKLEAIKSRIYKLLNIYSLIALKSINNTNNMSKTKDDGKKENEN